MSDILQNFLQSDNARENDYQRDLHESHSSRNPVYNWRKQSPTERLMTLTPPQKQVWVYIASYIHKYGYSPSVREIGRHCAHKSTSQSAHFLDKLREKNIITRKAENKGRSRAYTLFVWPPVESFINLEDG